MAIQHLASVFTEGSSGNTTSTSAGIDTSGASLIVMCAVWHQGSGPTITVNDSRANSWTPLTKYANGNNVVQFWYSVPSSVGSGHTFTINGNGAQIYSNVGAIAFSGTGATPFTNQESGAGGTSTTRQPGSLTPSEDNCVLVTGFITGSIGTNTINDGFATALYVTGGGTQGGGLSYKIQTTASAENPTWSNSGISGANEATMAVFRSAASGGSIYTGLRPSYLKKRKRVYYR